MVHEGEVIAVAEEVLTPEEFHRQMGHPSMKVAQTLVKDKYIVGIQLREAANSENIFCESCTYAKPTWKTVPKSREGNRAKDFGDEIHSDVWAKSPIESRGGQHYFILFVDDKTRFIILNLLRTKDEAFETYKPGWKLSSDGA